MGDTRTLLCAPWSEATPTCSFWAVTCQTQHPAVCASVAASGAAAGGGEAPGRTGLPSDAPGPSSAGSRRKSPKPTPPALPPASRSHQPMPNSTWASKKPTTGAVAAFQPCSRARIRPSRRWLRTIFTRPGYRRFTYWSRLSLSSTAADTETPQHAGPGRAPRSPRVGVGRLGHCVPRAPTPRPAVEEHLRWPDVLQGAGDHGRQDPTP